VNLEQMHMHTKSFRKLAPRTKRAVLHWFALFYAVFFLRTAEACQPIGGLHGFAAELNELFHSNVRLCDAFGKKGPRAWANVKARRVNVDSSWLDNIALEYGSGAAFGFLAHEWAHVVFRASELQADCLAGFALRELRFPRGAVRDFTIANSWHAGPTHGTPEQRVNAAERGYYESRGRISRRDLLTRLCPRGVR
jgi:hypothetical protein